MTFPKGLLAASAIALTQLLLSSLAVSQEVQGRVAVYGGKDGVSMTPDCAGGGSIMNADWDKDPVRAKQYVTAIFHAEQEWKRGSMTFTPDKDGVVSVSFMGAWNKDGTQTWTLIDDIKVSGAEIKNGSFEDGLANWTLQERDGKKASLSDVSKSGAKSLKASHDCSASQNVSVKGGQPVTIGFWYKSAE